MSKPASGPYVGPRPFTLEEASLFFGRDRESNDLLALIIAHPTVLFYSQSGAGKSSLLNANVIPLLAQRGSQVLGPARVSGRLPKGLTSEKILNVFTLNVLLSLQPGESTPERLSRTSCTDFLSVLPYPGTSRPGSQQRVLILDQFEEIFTSYQEKWADRPAFFTDLGASLEKDRRLRIVFAMREEYLAKMDAFAVCLPERLRTRFHLERLREKEALEAVENPLESTNRHYAPGAARKLVGNLRMIPVKQEDEIKPVVGEFVEPVQLQVVCQRLWNALPEEISEITGDYVESYGDVDQALASYYEECIRAVAGKFSVKEGVLRNWFESALITPQGTRGIAFKDADSTAGLSNKAVLALQNLYLIRPDVRGGAEWYELTHDRFIAPILRSNREWRRKRDRGTISSSELEARAKAWAAKGKIDSLLLSADELDRAVRWLASSDAEELGVSETLRDLVQASQAAAVEEKERVNRRLQVQRFFLGAVLLLALILSWITYGAKRDSEQASRIEKGLLAQELAAQTGNEFTALALGIDAVGTGDRPRKNVPKEALAGLRAALSAVGNSIWLRLPSEIVASSSSQDETKIASCSKEKIAVWETATGRPLLERPADANLEWRDAALSSQGTALCGLQRRREDKEARRSARRDSSHGRVTCWDIGSGREVLRTGEDFYYIKFLSRGDRVLTANQTGVQVRDLGRSAVLREIRPSSKPSWIYSSPDDSRLILVGASSSLWDILANPAQLLNGELPHVYGRFSPDSKRLFTIGFVGTQIAMQLWDAVAGKKLSDLKMPLSIETSLLYNGRFIVLASPERPEAQIYDQSGKLIKRQQVVSYSVAHVSKTGVINLYDINKDVLSWTQYDTSSERGPIRREIRGVKGKPIQWLNDDPSDPRLVLMLINERTLGVVDFSREPAKPMDLNSFSPDQLLRLACQRIQFQPEASKAKGCAHQGLALIAGRR